MKLELRIPPEERIPCAMHVDGLISLLGYTKAEADNYLVISLHEQNDRMVLFDSVTAVLDASGPDYNAALRSMDRGMEEYKQLTLAMKEGPVFIGLIERFNRGDLTVKAIDDAVDGISPHFSPETFSEFASMIKYRLSISTICLADHLISIGFLKDDYTGESASLQNLSAHAINIFESRKLNRVKKFTAAIKEEILFLAPGLEDILKKDNRAYAGFLVRANRSSLQFIDILGEAFHSLDNTELGIYELLSYDSPSPVVRIQAFNDDLAQLSKAEISSRPTLDLLRNIRPDERLDFFRGLPYNPLIIRLYEKLIEKRGEREHKDIALQYSISIRKMMDLNLEATYELITFADIGKRRALFNYVINNPEVINLYSRLKVVGTTASEFSTFIISYRDSRFNDKFSMLDAINHISSQGQPRNLYAAAYIVRNASGFVDDHFSENILHISINHESPCVVLDSYHTSKIKKNRNKAALALLLGMNDISQEGFESRWVGVDRIDDSEFDWAAQYLSERKPIEMQTIDLGLEVARLSIQAAREDIALVSAGSPRPAGISERRPVWYQDMMTQLSSWGFKSNRRKPIEAAYRKLLRLEEEIRMRDIWETQGHRLEAFSSDVNDLHNTLPYQILLHNYQLFNLYKSQNMIGNTQFRAELIKLKGSHEKIYQDLERLLSTNHDAKRTSEDAPLYGEAEKKNSIYTRIIIYGGNHINQVIPDLKKRFEQEVLFYDVNKNKSLPDFRATDLVIIAKNDVGHQNILPVFAERDRRRLPNCRKDQFDIHIYEGRGLTSLMNYISEKLAN